LTLDNWGVIIKTVLKKEEEMPKKSKCDETAQEIDIKKFEEEFNISIQKGKKEMETLLDEALEWPQDMLICLC